jgi:hypothetical protein
MLEWLATGQYSRVGQPSFWIDSEAWCLSPALRLRVSGGQELIFVCSKSSTFLGKTGLIFCQARKERANHWIISRKSSYFLECSLERWFLVGHEVAVAGPTAALCAMLAEEAWLAHSAVLAKVCTQKTYAHWSLATLNKHLHDRWQRRLPHSCHSWVKRRVGVPQGKPLLAS